MRDVLVVGGGPVGLLAATLLAQAGLDVLVWEKRARAATSSRAIGIHAPSLDALEAAGVAGQVLEAAVRIDRGVALRGGRVLGEVSFARAHPRYPFVAALGQYRTEALLAERLREIDPGCVRRGVELVGLVQEPGLVRVVGLERSTAVGAGGGGRADGARGVLPGDRTVMEEARFVVGADGARSVVRDLLGVAAPVHEYPDTYVMGDFADARGEPAAFIHLEPGGVVESFPLPGGARRFVAHTPHVLHDRVDGVETADPTAEALGDLVTSRTGYPVDASTVTMLSAFGVRRRFAERTSVGRVALVGDAAHEISPIGGQGMNLGWLDAVALTSILIAASRTGTLDLRALARVARTRTASARRAARAAEVNMALGRPGQGARLAVRDVALGAALRSPAGRLLASTYAMRWS